MADSGFASVSGLEGIVDVDEYREGTDRAARKEPGDVSYSNVVLRRGLTSSKELFKWWAGVAAGNQDRRNVSVVLLDSRGQDAARWNVHRAWPARYAVSILDAELDTVVMEILELANEGIERV
jgi:phage tail-like protein